MQITISFSEEEYQMLENWAAQIRPQQMEANEFYKQIFLNGVGAVNEQFSKLAGDSLRDPATREKLRQAGVDVEKLEQEVGITADTESSTDQETVGVEDESEQSDPQASLKELEAIIAQLKVEMGIPGEEQSEGDTKASKGDSSD